MTKRASEKTPIFRFLAFLLLPVMHVLARYRLHDGDKLPKDGAFVLAPNHYSEIDPVVVGVAMWKLGRMPRYLAKADLFKYPVIGTLLRASDQIPVERTGAVRGSDPLVAARKIVDKGLAVVIYPEGSLTRDPDLWPMRGKAGAVRMALQSGIPIIPVAHWGTQKVMPRYAKRISVFPRKTIDIKFGDPVDLSAFRDKPLDGATVTAATSLVMDAITALLEDLRDEKAPATRWDPSKNNQKETGRF
ncbi:lysophospholipid acyltransferase family protein [Marisediminicola sp. LYQ134]|uniref:lysophospholipid acyltransferase family protein n=1 Tax=unclassified Marisediminicola TaxID=2618316 RepID=UPI0039833924